MITHLISVSPARTRCLSVGSPVVITERTRCEGQGGQEETHCWWGTDGWAHMKNILFISTQTAKPISSDSATDSLPCAQSPSSGLLWVSRSWRWGPDHRDCLKNCHHPVNGTPYSHEKEQKSYTNKIVYNILRWNNFSKQWMCVCVYSNRHTHSHMCITIQENS